MWNSWCNWMREDWVEICATNTEWSILGIKNVRGAVCWLQLHVMKLICTRGAAPHRKAGNLFGWANSLFAMGKYFQLRTNKWRKHEAYERAKKKDDRAQAYTFAFDKKAKVNQWDVILSISHLCFICAVLMMLRLTHASSPHNQWQIFINWTCANSSFNSSMNGQRFLADARKEETSRRTADNLFNCKRL